MRSIVYHQNVVLYIINGETVAYHQADSFLIHTFGVMRYKCDLSHLMIYTLTRGDMPSLSAWINTKKERREIFVLFLCWHRPIFPGRFQPSIFGTDELNFCVRNGNRWTLTANDTNYLYYTLSFLRIQYLF